MQGLLKIERIDESNRGETPIQFGHHLFVDVTFDNRSDGTCLYWRLVDRAFSLLEVGFDAVSGQIRSFTVPLYNGEMFSVSDHDLNNARQSLRGVPIFDSKPWMTSENKIARNHVDITGRIRMEVSATQVRVVISNESVFRFIRVNSRIECDLNEFDEVIGFRVLGLSAQEKVQLFNESAHVRASRSESTGP